MNRLLASAAVLTLLFAACTTGTTGNTDPTSVDDTTATTRAQSGAPSLVAASLQVADDCDALLDYFIKQAIEQVGPWGLGGRDFRFLDDFAMEEAMASDSSSQGGGDGSAVPSATNVQVEGIDEGDIVKAVGDVLYVISDTRLVVFSTADGGIKQLSTLDLGNQAWGNQILVHDDVLVLMGAGSSTGGVSADVAIDSFAPIYSSIAAVTFVDVADPSAPTVSRRLTMDGSVVTSRLVDGHLRVVLQAEPVGLAWSYPEGSGLRAERAATERNRQIVRDSTIENWLPYLIDSDGDEQLLLECGDVYLPPEASGLGTLAILDFDLDSSDTAWNATSVVASGSTVYANLEHTYIATSRWLDPVIFETGERVDDFVTRIHRFDTPVDGELTYVASGDVDGFLLNQFSMDEYDGRLRVASTSAPWWRSGEDSQSRVTVLATEGKQLVVEGMVEGLGVTETIQAVRFMGPLGYVVTFRQTDPLYVIDLSDPSAPVAAGELKIPGFSAYLHPVADGRLLGVGQDADEDSGRQLGLQISLFDVSDATNPTRLDTFGIMPDDATLDGGVYSAVEHDHKAFTAVDGAAFVPYEGYSWSEEESEETVRLGVIEVDWSDDSLDGTRLLKVFEGQPRDQEWGFGPQRTVVKGDVAYAIGWTGITVFDLDTGEIVEQRRF